MLQRTEGIVCELFPLAKQTLSLPISLLISDFLKSLQKVRVRLKVDLNLEPLTYSKIAFWGKENTALPRLTQSDIMHSFHSIRDNLNYFLKVSEIIELTLCFIPERDVNRKVYSLLLNILQTIENNSSESGHTCSLKRITIK